MFLQNDVNLLINHLDRIFLIIAIPHTLVELQRSIQILTSLAIGHNLADLFILVSPAGKLGQHDFEIIDLLCDVDLVSDCHDFYY